MKNYLKLFLYSIFYITKNNLGKLILLVISIITFNYAGTFEDTKLESKVIKEIKIEDSYLYITKSIKNSEIEYSVIQRDKPEKLKDGKIIWYEYSDVNVLLWTVFVIFGVGLLILSFSDDVDWDIKYSYRQAIEQMFHSEYDEGVYYYIAFDRLIGKRSRQLYRNQILHEFDVYNLSDILFHAKIKTKSNRKEKKI